MNWKISATSVCMVCFASVSMASAVDLIKTEKSAMDQLIQFKNDGKPYRFKKIDEAMGGLKQKFGEPTKVGKFGARWLFQSNDPAMCAEGSLSYDSQKNVVNAIGGRVGKCDGLVAELPLLK